MRARAAHQADEDAADIAALADGSLSARRRAEVERRLARSPELQEALAREREAVAALTAARSRDRAPEALRLRVQQARNPSATRTRRPRAVAGVAAAGAAIIVAAVVLLAGQGPAGPTVAEAAGLAQRGIVAPAPVANPADPADLMVAGSGAVPFPNWSRSLGWVPVGQRADRLGGRRALTVFYRRDGRRLAYTIVSLPALPAPDGARTSSVGALQFRALRLHGRQVVTWRRGGRTCVLSSRGVSTTEMERLAAWSRYRG